MAAVVSMPLFFMGSCATAGLEKAKYSVLEKQGAIEVRLYEPQIVAETLVDENFDKAANIAFNRLFGYISGENRTSVKIDMTAPVNQEVISEKIKMTAPVNQETVGDGYAVNFLMPSKYSLATLPEPVNEKVYLREIPVRKIAALRYSGTWSQKRYKAQKTKLETFIRDSGLTATGSDIFARYDPPFQIWFLRRNEVLIPVE